jgi:hypothetical protein
LVELDETHRRLWIRLASVSRFSVALDRATTTLLIDALDGVGTCTLRCDHEHGPHLLGARPNPEPWVIPHSERRFSAPPHGGPMRVYLHLSEEADDRIDVTLTRPTTLTLVDHLRSCHAAMIDS